MTVASGGDGDRVIGKISTPRGEHVEPLLYYLFGPGRHEEHTDPHIVAGWRHPASLEPALRPDGKRDFATLTGLLKQPQAALGERGYAQPVWHCSLRAAPGDRMLSDDEWAVIAHEVMHRTGLSPSGQEDEAVRWIAVRHGDDHIHLVAMLARQDGGKPSLSWERYKVRAACLAAEQRYGLRPTAPADHTAGRRPTRAENEKATRRGLEEAPRITLRRQVTTAAASASSADEFFARLDQAGVLVRKRFSISNPGQVTGYSIALPGDTTTDGRPVWYGGGKLAADLSWPRLQHRWTPPRATPGVHLTAEERNAVWDHATRAAADAAWATSDTLHAAAAMLGSRILRRAADAYDRAARPPYGRIPPPSAAGNHLRQAARLLSAFGCLTGDRSMAPIVLITRLAALAEAVAELRDTQQHAAQAAAAHAAAGQLYAAARPAPPAQPRPAQRASTAAELAGQSFPQPARPATPPATPGQPGPGVPPPVPRPPPPRPPGPARLRSEPRTAQRIRYTAPLPAAPRRCARGAGRCTAPAAPGGEPYLQGCLHRPAQALPGLNPRRRAGRRHRRPADARRGTGSTRSPLTCSSSPYSWSSARPARPRGLFLPESEYAGAETLDGWLELARPQLAASMATLRRQS